MTNGNGVSNSELLKRIEQLEDEFEKMIPQITQILEYCTKGFPQCALEAHRVKELEEEQDRIKKRIWGNGSGVGVVTDIENIKTKQNQQLGLSVAIFLTLIGLLLERVL